MRSSLTEMEWRVIVKELLVLCVARLPLTAFYGFVLYVVTKGQEPDTWVWSTLMFLSFQLGMTTRGVMERRALATQKSLSEIIEPAAKGQ